jgi:transketolase
MANAVRALSMDAVERAKSGHPGMPMGMADVASVLFAHFLKFDAKNPLWADRDRFIHSAGHGSMLLYSILHMTGYEAISMDDLKNFRQLHSITAGHPEVEQHAGIEITTGPLGQGISSAVGFALSERILNQRYGSDLVDHYTYVICGDGDLMEGVSHEACSLAGHLNLSRLIVLYDDNGITIDGSTDLSFTEDVTKRYESYGWAVLSIDGHDYAAIYDAIKVAKTHDKPTLIRCKAHIGFGAPTKQGKSSSHGSPLGAEELAGAKKNLGWDHAPFVIPSDILTDWQNAGKRSANEVTAWTQRLEKSSDKDAFNAQYKTDPDPKLLQQSIDDAISEFLEKKSVVATRAASGMVLEHLIPNFPQLIGGSADLTGSVNTKTKNIKPVSKENYDGQYIHYGVREHGMAAIMNGMALHGGIIPYSGTFLSFSDYCRPSIRLSALMKQRVIYVMTHDSIGLGEDGPTHQPVEHLSALRAIPNLYTFRPADPVEVAECWALALSSKETPSVISLTRQNVPLLRTKKLSENLSAKGAYILSEVKNPVAVLMASGSEVGLAMEAQEKLAAKNIAVNVVSVPSMELFRQTDKAYQDHVLGGAGVIKIAIEAAIAQPWYEWIGHDGIFIGMNGFGASAPADQLYDYFKITADEVVKTLEASLKKA